MIESARICAGDDDAQQSVVTHAEGPTELVRKGVLTKPWAEWLTTNADIIGIGVLLLTLFVALFHRALEFQPADPHDLRFLSQVATTPNPFKYLVGDWGEAPYFFGDYGLYRPIHPISIWVVYKLFGVNAEPNQWINLTLHLANVLLVLRIVLNVQKDRVVGLLCTALFMVSMYTVSPAIWVTDRCTLQVGLALLLLIQHIIKANENKTTLRISYVIFLSCLALLSKENGIIVPLFALIASLYQSPSNEDRIRAGGAYLSVIGLYFLGRFLMFGSHAVVYHNGGYLFGILRYDNFHDLPAYLQTLSLIDNPIKNVISIFIPIFGELGELDLTPKVVAAAITTVTLVVISCKKPTILQMYCLGIVILNAAIHFQIYRYRELYLSQIAFSLFLAAGPVVKAGTRSWVTFRIALVVLLLLSIVRVDTYIQGKYIWRLKELQVRSLERSLKYFPGRIDPEVTRRVLERYQ